MSYLGKKKMEKWTNDPKNLVQVPDEAVDYINSSVDSVNELVKASHMDWHVVNDAWLNHHYSVGMKNGELLSVGAIGLGVVLGLYGDKIKAKFAEIREKWKSKKSEPEIEEEES